MGEPESFLGFHTCTHSMYVNMSSHERVAGLARITSFRSFIVMTITSQCVSSKIKHWPGNLL